MKARINFFLILLIAAIALFCFAACNNGQDGSATGGENESGATGGDNQTPDFTQPDGNSSVLIVYFSCTNTTKGVAQKIAEATGGGLFRIIPSQEYTSDDLNYNDNGSRANREQNDSSARPAISNRIEDISQYGAVFIGYPIWWGKLPKIIYTFLDEYDLSGKTVVPFCTSGGSAITASVGEIRAEEPSATVLDGRRFNGSDGLPTVQQWVNGLNLNIKKEAGVIKVHCGSNALDIELADNPSARAFYEKLREGDVTVSMHDYGDFEKVGELGFSLVQTNTQITTSPGDVILYQGKNVTIYYDKNSWDFTLLGKIKGATRDSILNDFFGGPGNVTVRFSLK